MEITKKIYFDRRTTREEMTSIKTSKELLENMLCSLTGYFSSCYDNKNGEDSVTIEELKTTFRTLEKLQYSKKLFIENTNTEKDFF